MPKIMGVILAGGRGQRLGGVVKANLRLGGIPLIDRVSNSIRHQCDAMVVSVGRLPAGAVVSALPLPQINDTDGIEAGPVAGLAAAVEWCVDSGASCEFMLTAAVDTPFFPNDFAAKALPQFSYDIDVVVGQQHGQIYPTCAVWRFSALLGLPNALLRGENRNGLKNIIPHVRTQNISWPEAENPGVFSNINTMTDMLSSARWLAKPDIEDRGNSGLGKPDQTG